MTFKNVHFFSYEGSDIVAHSVEKRQVDFEMLAQISHLFKHSEAKPQIKI